METTRTKAKKKASFDVEINVDVYTFNHLCVMAREEGSFSKVISDIVTKYIDKMRNESQHLYGEEWTKDKDGNIVKTKVPFGLGEK